MLKKYFARANTSAGCVNLMKNNLENIEKLYILKGSSKTAKTMVIKNVSDTLAKQFSRIEAVISPFNIMQYDGVIIRDIKTAVVDEDCIEKDCTGHVLDCDAFLKLSDCEAKKEYLCELKEKADRGYMGLYAEYEKGKEIHDEWEKIYIDNINFDRLNSYCQGVVGQLIGDKKGNKGTQNFERFFGASTVDGSVNYIDNLTENLSARYFIKGRPGTGKSTFLKKLARAAQEAGFDTEVYYCSFDKNSLDMVVVPELSFCVFDSTAPHEMFPSASRDSILDFYTESGLFGVDERHEKELELISKKYKHRISAGLAQLRVANLCMAEREFYLKRTIDNSSLEKACDEILKEIIK
ncbi:MAG: hypothetical protein J6C82_00095 [Clostridia bacterium]|nr:hypothetical protein [Clostridia bacterium]